MKFLTAEERTRDPFIMASQVNALLRAAICADETTLDAEALFGDSDKGIWQLLEVAERMSAEVMRDIETMQRDLGRGMWGASRESERDSHKGTADAK